MITATFSLRSLAVYIAVAGLCGRGATAVRADDVAEITDSSGTVFKLTSVKAEVVRDISGALQLRGRRYADFGAIPAKLDSGITAFVWLEQVREVMTKDQRVTIACVDGKQIEGALEEYRISGDSELGEIILTGDKIARLRINVDRIERKKTLPWRHSGTDEARDADLSLADGKRLSLGRIQFVVERFIPVPDQPDAERKSYPSTDASLPVTVGDASATLELAKVVRLEFKPKPEGGAENDLRLDVALGTGTHYQALFSSSPSSSGLRRVVGFLGATEYGYAHVPIELVKTVEFKAAPTQEQQDGESSAIKAKLKKLEAMRAGN